ncbi:MAG TPA: hypothetical protein VF048_05355 [Gemmatimonadaceae bacterium]
MSADHGTGAPADVVLLGAGAIGRELVAQLLARRARPLPVRLCALADSTGFLFDADGLPRRRLAAAVALKDSGGNLADAAGAHAGDAHAALDVAARHALYRPILIDATAADTGALLERALAAGFDLVLANKLPLATEQAAFDRLYLAARTRGRALLHEATVGAGLPVIDTLHRLLDGGDRVRRIEGCPSGTLGYLFGELGRGRAFSEALRGALAAGYTEPDPRIDLAGLDVARKALILARALGYRGEPEGIPVESLVPASLRDVSRDEFLARVGELDAGWAGRVRAAAARGRVLRYRARVTARSIRVGLVAVRAGHPLGTLRGTDNQFAFTTARYARQPLVVTGPGAGPAVTAAGVLGDVLRLAAPRGLAAPPPAPARRVREYA